MDEFDDSPALQDLQDNYNMDNKMTSKDGNIFRTFVCKFSKKKKGFNCPVKARTVFSGNKMTIYRLDDTVHDHEASERKNFAFDKKAEEKMKELLVLNVSTRNIRKHLLDKGFYTKATFPSDQILYSKMSNLRKKLNLDRKKIGLKEFEEIIKQYSVEPEDSTEPFIVKSLVEEDEAGNLRYSVMFSSKHLIQTYMQPNKKWLLSLDATYQTNTEDCPLIFFGSSTKSGKFNGIGAILSNREDKAAYDFLFNMVKQVAKPIPSANRAISASILDILPSTTRLTCFFHVMKNVKQKLSKV